MLRVIIRGFLSRKLRSALTAAAIFLGVAMISGTFVLTDKINAAFSDIFKTGNKNVDVSITKHAAFGADASNGGGGVPFDAAVVDRIQQVSGVRQVAAAAEGSGFLVNGSHKLTSQGGAPSILSSVEPQGITAYTAVDGAFPTRSGQVAVDQKMAEDENLSVGQRLQLSTLTGLHPVTIAGVVKFGDVSSIGGARIVLAPLRDVQDWSHLNGKATRIDVSGDGSVDDATMVQEVRSVVPSDLTVETGAANAAQQADDVASNLSFLNYLLLAFGFVAVFVGAFIIFNTYSITVAQRTKEFGVLRSLGATGRQTLLMVLGEALIVGVLATAAGILGGVGFAASLTWLFDKFGLGIPSVGTIVKARTVVWAVTVGLGITLVAALLPAVRAMGVSPLAALRDAAAKPRRHSWRRAALAVLLFALAAVMIGFGVSGDAALAARLVILAGGALVFFVAVALTMVYLVKPVVAVLGVVVRRLGGEGRLATGNTTRNPERTAVTAAALMIGTGLVVFVAILGSGFKASIGDSIDKSVHGDLMVSSETQGTAVPNGAVQALGTVPGVETVSPVTTAPVQLGKSTQTPLIGVDSNLDTVYKMDWKQGSDSLVDDLGRSGAIVETGIAKSAGVDVGDEVKVTGETGHVGSFVVKGIYEDPMVLNGVIVSHSALRPFQAAGTSGAAYVFVKDAAGASAAAVAERAKSALKDFPSAKVESNADVKKRADQGINQMLTIFYALLAMSVIISLFGIVNTLVLSVYERTREIGVLRAVGTTRRQVRRMIRYESVMTAVLGALLGVVVGVVFGFAITTALSGEGLTFVFPGEQVAIFLLLSVLAGVLAAILPARRAAHLDVLQAVQHQ
jgi:putative ABC transport system permease protein